jgi:hypothetical protein
MLCLRIIAVLSLALPLMAYAQQSSPSSVPDLPDAPVPTTLLLIEPPQPTSLRLENMAYHSSQLFLLAGTAFDIKNGLAGKEKPDFVATHLAMDGVALYASHRLQ